MKTFEEFMLESTKQVETGKLDEGLANEPEFNNLYDLFLNLYKYFKVETKTLKLKAKDRQDIHDGLQKVYSVLIGIYQKG